MWEKYAVPLEMASGACKSYLRAFRKCPENLSMNLDSWRLMLWSQSLGDQYGKLAGKCTVKYLKYKEAALYQINVNQNHISNK